MPYIFYCCFALLFIISASHTKIQAHPTNIPQVLGDTTPPTQKGVVKIKPLPSKKKRRGGRGVLQNAPTKKQNAPTNPTTETNPNNKTTAEEQPAPFPVEEEQPAVDSSNTAIAKKTAPPKNKPNKPTKSQSRALSAEEELRLLAQAPTTTLNDRAAQPSTEQCAFAFDHIDEFSGTRKRGLRPRLFFTYTPEQYRQFIKTQDFIRCEGYLSQNSEGDFVLNISLVIANPAAREKFGDIAPTSNLTIRTMEGKEYFLKTFKGAPAVVKGQQTQYEASFVLTKADAKQLREAEIDQVRLRFTKGFQLYEVYYLDFLREQFPCFKR